MLTEAAVQRFEEEAAQHLADARENKRLEAFHRRRSQAAMARLNELRRRCEQMGVILHLPEP